MTQTRKSLRLLRACQDILFLASGFAIFTVIVTVVSAFIQATAFAGMTLLSGFFAVCFFLGSSLAYYLRYRHAKRKEVSDDAA